MTRPYENLINAIILQAVKGLSGCLKAPEEKPQNTDHVHCDGDRTVTILPGIRPSPVWTALPNTKAARGGEVKMTIKNISSGLSP